MVSVCAGTGAIRAMDGRLNITNSIIDHNRAYRHGAGIYAGANNDNSAARSFLWVNGTKFDNNVAEANGGQCLTLALNSVSHTGMASDLEYLL